MFAKWGTSDQNDLCWNLKYYEMTKRLNFIDDKPSIRKSGKIIVKNNSVEPSENESLKYTEFLKISAGSDYTILLGILCRNINQI